MKKGSGRRRKEYDGDGVLVSNNVLMGEEWILRDLLGRVRRGNDGEGLEENRYRERMGEDDREELGKKG